MTWVLAAQAADATSDIARLLFGRPLPIAKRVEPNPITQEGFAALLHSLSLAMLQGIAPTEEAAMLRAIQGLDVNWATLTEAQRDNAIARAMGALAGVPRIVGPKVGEVLRAKGKTIVESTKAATRDKYGLAINPSFDAVDAAVVSHAATSQAFYIRNEYGKRVDVYSELARQIVADGLEKGLDRYQIGKTLKGVLAGTSADRSEAYFRMVASVFAARSRAYATATSFEEAGIESAEWSSVLDEVTSDVCRFMDGKVIPVRSLLSGFERVAASENPEDVREIQPFANVSRDENGQYLYFKRGGQRVQIARVDESGVGVADAKGSYSSALSGKDLVQTGVTPPAHPHCFPPGTLVATPHGDVAIERLWVGDIVMGGLTGRPRVVVERHEHPHEDALVEVVFDGGAFQVTANHPLLTSRGWVEAGALQVGDKLCRQRWQTGIAHANPLTGPPHDLPAKPLEEGILAAVDRCLARRAVPLTRVDLDGDAQFGEGEVDVELAHRELAHGGQLSRGERPEEDGFDGARPSRHDALRVVDLFGSRPGLTPAGRVGRVRQGHAFLGGRLRHASEHRIGPVSVGDSGPVHRACDGDPAASECGGDSLHREPLVEVHGSDLLDVERKDVRTHVDPLRLEGPEDRTGPVAEVLRDRGTWHAGQVQPRDLLGVCDHGTSVPRQCATVDVFSVQRVPFAGMVHNIGVDIEEAYLICGDVVVHNCRSLLIPASESHSTVQVPGQVRPSLPPMAPQVPLAPSAPMQLPMVFTNLPADLAQQVRQPGTRIVDTETLPPYVAPPPALTPEQQKIADALKALSNLPTVKSKFGGDNVLHGLPVVPQNADGSYQDLYYDGLTTKQLTAAKKLKAKPVAIADIVLGNPGVAKVTVESTIKDPDGADIVLVKRGGKFYSNAYSTRQIVAAHLGGDTTLQVKVIDLDKKKPTAKPKAPKPAPAPTAPPPAPTADVILGTKMGVAKGSNEGGFYRGTDGVERYVKFYDDPTQAHCEHLANSIYRDLGVEAPDSITFQHNGKTAYASVLFKGGKTLQDVGLTPANAGEVMKGFVADVLTANWDAVGMGMDNVFILPNGRAARVDNGGTLLLRAQGSRKPKGALNGIGEWASLLDPSVNHYYANVAKTAGVTSPEDMKATVVDGIKNVLDLRKKSGGWKAYVDAAAPGLNATDKAAVVEMLESRSSLLEAKLGALTAKAKKAPAKAEHVYSHASDATFKIRDRITQFSSDGIDDSFYDHVFKEGGVSKEDKEAIRSTVRRWTEGDKDAVTQKKVYAAYADWVKGKPATSEFDSEFRAAKETRVGRWRAALDKVGLKDTPVPTHFELFRGLSGKEFVQDVARAWADDKVTHVNVRSYEAASWSMREKTGHKFAETTGVVAKWRCPMENTLYDQIADDSAFVSVHHTEHEVIAGTGAKAGVTLPKEEQLVRYKDQVYTYAERATLLAKLKKDGVL